LKIYRLSILFALVVSLMGCGEDEKHLKKSEENRAAVVSSIFPLGDLVKNLLGERKARFLIPPRANPHSYEPSPNDMKALRGVKIAILVGGGLDNWVEKLLKHEPDSRVRIVRVLSMLDKKKIYPMRQGHDHKHGEKNAGTVDPHVWLDPVIMKEIVKALAVELSKSFPEKVEVIVANSERYLKELDELDLACKKRVASLKERNYVSVHGAFYYFSKRYGLSEKAVIEPFPGKEPSVRWMKKVIREAREHNVKTVWAEPQLSNKSADLLAEELGGRVIVLDPIGDPADKEKDSYIKLMKYNLDKLVEKK